MIAPLLAALSRPLPPPSSLMRGIVTARGVVSVHRWPAGVMIHQR
jgi:hypothetical protein